MKKLIFIFLTFFLISKFWACSCAPPSVTFAYGYSKVIFLGKFIDTKYSEIGNENGYPFYTDNFEVFQFYKGRNINDVLKNNKKISRNKVIISLNSKCRPSGDAACGMCFTKDKYYIIYAYKDFYGELITTDACAPTREIREDELNSYMKYDTLVKELNLIYNLQKKDTVFKVPDQNVSKSDYVEIERLAELKDALYWESKNKLLFLITTIILFISTFFLLIKILRKNR